MEPKFIPVDAGRHFSLVGIEIWVRTSARDTQGALTVLEQLIPKGAGSPLHTVLEDKVLMVVGGHVSVQLGTEQMRLGPGESAVIPRGTPHRFHNAEVPLARLFMLIMPGGHEAFLSELAQLEVHGALSPEAMTDLGQRYGVTILPDPLHSGD